MKASYLFTILISLVLVGCGGKNVKYFSGKINTDAVYTPALNTNDPHPPAVIVIHSAGGSNDGTTSALSASLNKQGIATLQPSYWKRPDGGIPPEFLVPTLFGAIDYLVKEQQIDPKRIGIAGYSFGAHMSLLAASEYLTETEGNGYQFAAIAPIYPACWLNEQVMLGKRDNIKGLPRKVYLPGQTFTNFIDAPIAIFAAGKDDYDARDPDACLKMLEALSPEAKKNITLKVYPEATHGWNQIHAKRKPLKLWAPFACKGEGCEITLEWNQQVTDLNVKEVTDFFVKNLK